MVKILYHILYLLVMKTSILVGGQAVIEGVMMRVPGAYATALRRKDGSIVSKRYNFESIIEKKGLKNYFILRGMIHLYESMQIGYKTLNWSADIYEEAENPINSKKSFFQNIVESISNIIAIIFAVSLFILLPLFTTR